jgi:hypothetical protein
VGDQQAVLQTLGKVEGKSVDAILLTWRTSSQPAKCRPSFSSTCSTRGAQQVVGGAGEGQRVQRQRPKDDVLAPFRECLAGGDPAADARSSRSDRTSRACAAT